MDDVPYHSTKHLLAEPAEQVQERNKEAAQVTSALPILNDIIARFEARVNATDSVKQALQIAKTYNISRENALVILDVLNNQLLIEKGTLEELIRAHVN